MVVVQVQKVMDKVEGVWKTSKYRTTTLLSKANKSLPVPSHCLTSNRCVALSTFSQLRIPRIFSQRSLLTGLSQHTGCTQLVLVF